MQTKRIRLRGCETELRLRVYARATASQREGSSLTPCRQRTHERELLSIQCEALLEEIEERKLWHAGLKSRLVALGLEIEAALSSCDALGAASIVKTSTGWTVEEKAVLNVVVVAAECAPYSKTGGLGDVTSALPKSLAAEGHKVMIVTPRYGAHEDATFTGMSTICYLMGQRHEVYFYHLTRDGVDIVFVDHPSYHHWCHDIYGGERLDVAFRCALLSKAALEAPQCLKHNSGVDDFIYIANDWHTALLPVYLKAYYKNCGRQSSARSVLVVHNLAFQGRGPIQELGQFDIPEEYRSSLIHGDPNGGIHMNILKGALMHADRIVAVSPEYAWECQTLEGGRGLDGIVREQSHKLSGIINGIDSDLWNPSSDVHLKQDGYINYDRDTLENKAICKHALQTEMGLLTNADIPLLCFIGRLDDQKGVDLIQGNHDWLMDRGVQLILLGSGREDLEDSLRVMSDANSKQCRSWIGFSDPLVHRMIAGSDLLLMPSRFEPCGLNQLYAFAYGTVPVVHATGGLRDTVIPFDPYNDVGNGWTFDWATVESMRIALDHALLTYHDFPGSFKQIQIRGMEQDLDWRQAAQQYIALLHEAKNEA